MKVVLAILVVLLTTAGAAQAAHAARWTPGTNYLVSEDDATRFLEKRFDHAYCDGVPRFGHRGEFPDEEFVVFDCSLTVDRQYCSDVRVKAVKGAHRGYFRIRLMRGPSSCF